MWNRVRNRLRAQDGDSFAPHGLQAAAALGMLCMVVLTFTIANFHSLVWTSSSWLVGTILPAVIVEETNNERASVAVQTLVRNPLLDEAARRKAEHMAREQYFAHYSPDGVSPWYWFNEVSYNFAHAGENLAIHFTDSSRVVDAWMNSPLHRDNIVNSKFREIGVAAVSGEYQGLETVYVVQLFGTPAAVNTDHAGTDHTVIVGRTLQVASTAAENDVAGVATSSAGTAQAINDTTLTSSSNVRGTTTPDASAADNNLFREDVVVTNESVSVFSDRIATSSGARAASTTVAVTGNTIEPTTLATLSTQPQQWLQYAFMMLGLLVVGMTLLSIFIEVQRNQPVQVMYGIVLLLVMYALFNIHLTFTQGVIVA